MVTRSARKGAALAATTLTAAFLLLAPPPDAGAISSKQADEIAIKALKPQKQGDGVALFAEPKVLRKGTVVGATGVDGELGNGATDAPGTKLDGKAYLYWLDLDYAAMFEHPSTLLLLDKKTGKRIERRDMLWEPLIDGRPPSFLASAQAYQDDRYQLYVRHESFKEPDAPRPLAARQPAAPRAPPAGTFARDCMVMIGDTKGRLTKGNFVAFGKWATSVDLKHTTATTVGDLEGKVKAYVEGGCKDVFIYVTGHGNPPPDWVDEHGHHHTGGRPGVQGDPGVVITPQHLEDILKRYPHIEFKIKIDSCFSGRFATLKDNKNLRVLELSSGPEQTSKGYDPNAEVEKKKKKKTVKVKWSTIADNPDGASEFTNGDIHGLTAWGESTTEMTQNPGLEGAIARSLVLGVDFNYTTYKGNTITKPEVYTNPALDHAPTPKIEYGPKPTLVNQPVQFDGTGSTDIDGDIQTYQWDFGDGTTSSSSVPTHTYTATGTYTVRLTVTDADGNSRSATETITVTTVNQSPTAAFTFSPNNAPTGPKAGQTITFDGSGSTDDGTIASYSWNFAAPPLHGGGGQPSSPSATGPTPTTTVSFDKPGVYPVTLTVTDNNGASQIETHNVFVSGPGPKDATLTDIPCDLSPPSSGFVDINIPTYAQNPTAIVQAQLSGCPGRTVVIDSVTVVPGPVTPEAGGTVVDEWGQQKNHLHIVFHVTAGGTPMTTGSATFRANWN